MLYIIDNKKVRINTSKLEILGEGLEGVVYNYKSSALKLYHNNPYCKYVGKRVLDFDGFKYLKNLKVKRFVFPTKEVLNRHHKFVGYISPLIESKDDIYEMKCYDFINESEILKDDIKTLSDKFVKISDVDVQNYIFNGKINIIDPGSYIICNKLNVSDLYDYNIDVMDTFLRRIIESRCTELLEEESDEIYAKFLNSFRDDFCINDLYISESLKKCCNQNVTVSEFALDYVKKKCF